MKKLVAWKEEPVMEAPFENEESEVTVSMNHEETHADEDEKDEPETLPVKRPSKKELDREEGRRGNERKPSNRVTYMPDPGQPETAPSVPYRPGVARGSYRPTGVQGYVTPAEKNNVPEENVRILVDTGLRRNFIPQRKEEKTGMTVTGRSILNTPTGSMSGKSSRSIRRRCLSWRHRCMNYTRPLKLPFRRDWKKSRLRPSKSGRTKTFP